jgi:hypothetical protein
MPLSHEEEEKQVLIGIRANLIEMIVLYIQVPRRDCYHQYRRLPSFVFDPLAALVAPGAYKLLRPRQ